MCLLQTYVCVRFPISLQFTFIYKENSIHNYKIFTRKTAFLSCNALKASLKPWQTYHSTNSTNLYSSELDWRSFCCCFHHRETPTSTPKDKNQPTFLWTQPDTSITFWHKREGALKRRDLKKVRVKKDDRAIQLPLNIFGLEPYFSSTPLPPPNKQKIHNRFSTDTGKKTIQTHKLNFS